jgi:cobalt-zinc-cadmium efflux system outer membrane protein
VFRSIVLFCFILSAGYADAAPDGFSVANAVSMALTNHPAAIAFEANQQAFQAHRNQAGLRPNPEAEFGAGYKDTETDSGYEIDAALNFPIERRGKRAARIGIAESDILIAEADRAQWQRDLELQVRMLAYDYLTASADAEIAREIAERSRAMIDLLKQRPAAGPAMVIELRIIEASLVEFQNSAREFESQRDSAKAALNILLKRDTDSPLILIDDLHVPSINYDVVALSASLEKSPALMKRLAEATRAAREASAAALEAKPDFGVGPYVSREDAGDTETTVGLAISIPLTWRNRNQGMIAAAKARQTEAEAQWESARLSARTELVQLHHLYEAAVAQVESIPPELVSNLHDAADLADRQYRQGAIPVQLFLDMQREFLNVQLLRHNTLLESLTLAAELEWLAGSAIEENLP